MAINMVVAERWMVRASAGMGMTVSMDFRHPAPQDSGLYRPRSNTLLSPIHRILYPISYLYLGRILDGGRSVFHDGSGRSVPHSPDLKKS